MIILEVLDNSGIWSEGMKSITILAGVECCSLYCVYVNTD